MLRTAVLLLLLSLAFALPAHAQVGGAPGGCNVVWNIKSDTANEINSNDYLLIGRVEIDCNTMQLFADKVEVLTDADRLRAWGNVVVASVDSRVAADQLEFNTHTKTGTFFVASGIASIANRGVDRSFFGTQEPSAYFWGRTIEKLGPKTYRISHGGFTTCVQPTPRWELISDSAVVTLEDHAVLKNTLLMVKSVPVFYLPIMYYPINKEDRATGFVMPQYGTSTIRGTTLSDAFFWAIDRSRDATLYGDYFSKTGFGYGGEYEYVQAPGSQGKVDVDIIREHDALYTQSDGSVVDHPADSSYSIIGTVAQALPDSMRLSGNANYFSSLTSQERYQQNIYQATNTTRSYGVNLTGNWGANGLSVATNRSEVFVDQNDSTVVGSLPRVDFTRAEKQLGDLPIYVGSTSEWATLIRTEKSATTTIDQGLTRFDVFPTVRVPFTKLSFLTFNTTIGFRDTYWTQSLDDAGQQAPVGLNRHYVTLSTSITGPVFSRIFSTPKLRYAQKWKHVVEPVFTISRTTAIPDASHVVQLEAPDFVVGSVTSMQYGVNNRLYAKRDTAREIVTVSISQSYYTDANAALVDQQYQSSFTQGLKPTNFSPVALQVHVAPTTLIDTSFRTEYDTRVHALRTVAANGTVTKGWVQASAVWSENRYLPQLPGFNVLAAATQSVGATTTIKRPGNGLGGTYAFNYDLRNSYMVNQKITAYYNTQCCGVGVEYQAVNYLGNVNIIGVPEDHRFNISFTLAGIGSFSNLLGSFGGAR
ncbi:MAG: LPS-assembly protein LptD [Vicinamibacterales bacterium]